MSGNGKSLPPKIEPGIVRRALEEQLARLQTNSLTPQGVQLGEVLLTAVRILADGVDIVDRRLTSRLPPVVSPKSTRFKGLSEEDAAILQRIAKSGGGTVTVLIAPEPDLKVVGRGG